MRQALFHNVLYHKVSDVCVGIVRFICVRICCFCLPQFGSGGVRRAGCGRVMHGLWVDHGWIMGGLWAGYAGVRRGLCGGCGVRIRRGRCLVASGMWVHVSSFASELYVSRGFE